MRLFTALLMTVVSTVSVAQNKPGDAIDSVIDKCLELTEKNTQRACVRILLNVAIESEKTPSTRDIVNKNYEPNEYVSVDPRDVQLGPKKFIGRPIQLRNMQCFYADINEYRCWSSGSASLTVFSTKVADHDGKAKFDDVCGQSKNMNSPLCRRTINIVAEDWDEDQPSAFGKRTIIRTPEISFAAPTPAKPKR